MQQMPYQSYVCPTCGDTIKSNSIYMPMCHTEGCKWIDMRPADELNNKKLGLTFFLGVVIVIVFFGAGKFIGTVILPLVFS